jgi:TatD DNase family protein
MHFVDSHAHLTGDPTYANVEEILKNAAEAQVHTIMNICTDKLSLQRGLELQQRLQQRYPGIHLAAAVHPHDANENAESYFNAIRQVAKSKAIKGVGETGLDYHYNHSPKTSQQDYLRRHLRLALECGLPVIIHCREAFADLFPILDEEYKIHGTYAPGVLHCFTGTADEAKKVLDMGWYLSFSGIVTFKKSTELQDIAKFVPLEQLLIETDTPYLAPQSQRGKPNQPAYLPEIASFLAKLKGLSLEQFAETTKNNASKLFGMP